ncbi:peptidoglycan-binding domain-containing protein [Thiohalocapsa sp. ML1]|jgi:peptidoglycan hydrolase-like protein with peptidoglycan-binding domain|uniref:peptidoglycan-binding domain-containing protein n=1 Tax=Thiohalocapsa sp. ML1 TaxID=1431688 RepID=UPI00073211DA|nr:peptidoglycan-binding domain-containing protein [Thiohalocapsa sp. ML1]
MVKHIAGALLGTLVVLVAEAAALSANTERAQDLLATQGYDPGPVDGLIGRKTLDALQAYQADHGLVTTRRVDDGTLKRLEVTRSRATDALDALGYADYSGSTDAERRSAVPAALRRFQSDHGLPVTGRADPDTIEALETEVGIARAQVMQATPGPMRGLKSPENEGAAHHRSDAQEIIDAADIDQHETAAPSARVGGVTGQHITESVVPATRDMSLSGSRSAGDSGAFAAPRLAPAAAGRLPGRQPETSADTGAAVDSLRPTRTALPTALGSVFVACIAVVATTLAIRHRSRRARVLERLRACGDAAGLVRRLARTRDPKYRLAIVQALSGLESPDAADALGAAVADPDPRVRAVAVAALARARDARAVRALGELVASTESSLGLRERAAVALGEIGKPDGLPYLERSWGTADWLMRGYILRAIAATGHPNAEQTIERLAASPGPERSGVLDPGRTLAHLQADAATALRAMRMNPAGGSSGRT